MGRVGVIDIVMLPDRRLMATTTAPVSAALGIQKDIGTDTFRKIKRAVD
jgi:hypothetical protein